jgi:hypothetical protein
MTEGNVWIASIFDTVRWHLDPDQKVIAACILDAARHLATEGAQGAPADIPGLCALQNERNWSDNEMKNRITHAVLMIEKQVDPTTFVCAKLVARGLHSTWSAGVATLTLALDELRPMIVLSPDFETLLFSAPLAA